MEQTLVNQDMPEIKLEPGLTQQAKPFAGFLQRLGAFVIDLLVLYFASRVLVPPLRGVMVVFNPYLPWLAHGAAFLYFALSAGPLGKGRTVGKSIIGIQIVGSDGKPLGWKPAAKRSILQQFCFLSLILLPPGSYNSIFLPDNYYGGMIFLLIISMTAFSTLIIQVLSLGIHPRNQCIHDFITGSYVTRDPVPTAFADAFLDGDIVKQRRIANHGKIIYLIWPLLSVALIYSNLIELLKPNYREYFGMISEVQTESPVAGYDFTFVRFPNPEMREQLEQAVIKARQTAMDANATDIPSTTTMLGKELYDGQSISVLAIRRSGAFPADELRNPDFLYSVDDLRHSLWGRWRDKQYQAEMDGKPLDVPARTFRMVVLEPCHFLFYDAGRYSAWIDGPADPNLGELDFREFPAMLDEIQAGEDAAPAPGTGDGTVAVTGINEDSNTTP